MPDIRLPDGSVRSYEAPLSGADIAADIGKRLAKDALAVRIDGELKDLGTLVDDDAEVAIVTAAEPDGLELLRHDAAHVHRGGPRRATGDRGVASADGPGLHRLRLGRRRRGEHRSGG